MGDGVFTRMGDGERIELDAQTIRQDLLDGTRDAAKRGKIPELTRSELDELYGDDDEGA